MNVPVSDLDELFNTYLAVQARITANLEAHAATLSLNASQLLVIRDVADHPGTPLTDVCRRCGLKKSAASRLIDTLVSRNMIVRTECPTSRRAVSLRLGPALSDRQFCRVTALTKALPGWSPPATLPSRKSRRNGDEGGTGRRNGEEREERGGTGTGGTGGTEERGRPDLRTFFAMQINDADQAVPHSPSFPSFPFIPFPRSLLVPSFL